MRHAALWIGSLLASIVMLWVARTQLGVQLVPDGIVFVDVAALVVACVLHVPYAVLRAMRLQVGLDPLVAAHGGTRFDRRALYGSGFVSFLVLLVLPFKLGEASRPILLARAEQPGVGVAEAIGVVGLERVVDGVLICTMLFGGLALAHADLVHAPTQLLLVQRFGQWMGLAFFAAFGFALLAAREPAAWGARITRWFAWQPAFAAWSSKVVVRVAESFAALLGARRLGQLVVISLAYWLVTVLQLGAVARACGLELSWPAAAATVAIIGLSIQLPGGPAQTGTFQVGAGAAMALFVHHAGDLKRAAHVDAFVATMFALPLLGAVATALAGLWLLARTRRPAAVPTAATIRPPQGPAA